MTDAYDGHDEKPAKASRAPKQRGGVQARVPSQATPLLHNRRTGAAQKNLTPVQQLKDLLSREITVRVGSREQLMTAQEALIKSALDQAMRGSLKDKLALLRLVSDLGDDTPPQAENGIISPQGHLRVRINIGKPPGLLDQDPPCYRPKSHGEAQD